MIGINALRKQTFSSLSNPNYRRYLSGQSTSLIGTWMQSIAQSWLVLDLTRSGTDVGLVVAVQTLPILLLGPYAGVIADRSDKRRLMIILQSLMGLQALTLGLLTVTHVVRLWEVFVLAAVLGLNNCFENPARQSFVLELVGRAELRNAVSLKKDQNRRSRLASRPWSQQPYALVDRGRRQFLAWRAGRRVQALSGEATWPLPPHVFALREISFAVEGAYQYYYMGSF